MARAGPTLRRIAFWRTILLILLCLPIGRGNAQYQTRPALPWRTVDMGHFRVHFPTELEPWGRIVASKLPAVDSAVTRIVGYVPPRRIDIVIDDPFGIPNGSAWPLLEAPRILMWATPPDPRDDIGTFVSWADMLATHEYTHLAHLLRPSRNPTQSLLWALAPTKLGPLSIKSPRWVIEGYATYVEGVVTGSGRPNGVWRPSILRQWAIEGVLPTYSQLDATSGMYGGEFAYLAGSSFLEWLATRRGDSSLVALWRRMSARQDRGFTEAFTGVYGEGPEILYGRFAAEVTADAKRRQATLKGDTGKTIQHLARETGDPAISLDGGRAAIVLASATRPGRVVIWRTIPEPDTSANRAARDLVAHDPEDVPPYRPFPPPRKALATLRAVGNQSYQDPRFFRDGRVLVWRNSAIGDGSYRPDLYIWDPQRGSVRRLTRRANVRQGDPSPDGTWIAATKCGAGKCDLVRVDAASGAVTVLAAGDDARSFYRPRVSPNGRTIAVALHSGGYWRAALYEVATRVVTPLTQDERNYFDVAFADDTTLVAAADDDRVLDIVRLGLDGRSLGRITSVSGAAVAPEVNPADGSIWFLSLHARGWDVRSVRQGAAASFVTSGRTPHLLPSSPVPATQRYTPDRKWGWFPGGSVVRDGAGILLGVAHTDPVGRTELLAQGTKSIGPTSFNAPLEGGLLSLTRRERTTNILSLFALRQDGPFRHSVRGAAFSIDDSRRFERYSMRVTSGASWSRAQSLIEPDPGSKRWLAFIEEGFSATRFKEGRRTTLSLAVHHAFGRRDDASIGRHIVTGTISSTEIPIAFTALGGFADRGTPEPFVIGGSPPTLAPTGLLTQYIAQPALSPFFTGERVEAYRLSVPFGGARIFGWSGRAFTGSARPQYEKIVGAEWTIAVAAIPILGTPAARATIGAGDWVNAHVALRQNPGDPAVHVAPGGRIQLYITTQFGDWSR